ncbi:MAG: carboxypeptidase-like regulatory domain-containing protein [Flavobacteriaceae bacterium]|nr:carboxypeptidase-like regulatory domain-containing protein [Flavobacteriaceae bacterium]
MRIISFFLVLLCYCVSSAQIRGKVLSKENAPVPFVNIFIENTYIGTASNEYGNYELNYNIKGKVVLIFQNLGYKSQKHILDITGYPYNFDVVMEEEDFQLQEVVLTNGENPANQIIKNAIASKKKNTEKTNRFEADFYSRGIFRAKDIPEKFMGIEIGDLEGNLDSTRSGVIYLSETVSKIKFEKPNNLKEDIIASKVAGNDNGFSFNTALNTDYDFYSNYVDFGINMISPLADNAFNYYKFQLESTFYDDNGNLINKIKITPKRDKEPVFEGYLYIIENSWAIYGVDVDIKGYRMQQPIIETLKLNQNYSYNQTNGIWIKNVQSLDFIAGIFGMQFTGKFSYVFSNYIFKDAFDKKTFGKEIVSFEANANKKEDEYWQVNRQIPLTNEEIENYTKKDSIQALRTSQVYLDSIDNIKNKFKVFDIIKGYTYKNSFKKWSFNYDGLLDFSSLSYNTVQGWNLDSGFTFRKENEEKGKYTSISSIFNYGFAEDRLRVTGNFYHRFNNINKTYISVSGGSAVSQFNASEPISKLINSLSTLLFTNNFMKLYNKEFVEVNFGQEVVNGIFLNGKLEYENRHELFNTTNYKMFKSNDVYSSNNPLAPLDYVASAFNEHHIYKGTIATRIRFGQKYISRPNAKVTIQNDNYPVLSFAYTKAFAATNSDYEYDFVSGRIDYDKTLGNKGDFALRFKAGKFFNADNITFIDYKHFNGNQTHVNFKGDYLNTFNLLPYYSNSTNDAYLETHIEHNFKGYIMNKIPLLNKLQWNLIGSFHQINVPHFKPYQEFTVGFDNIGFGKFRFLRIDYVRAYQNGYLGDGVMFGLQF